MNELKYCSSSTFTLKYCSSSTFTLVDHDAATGAEKTSTTHTARFIIPIGYLPDMRCWHRSHDISGRFRPVWLQARWINGELREVTIDGPRVHRDGRIEPQQFRTLRWRPHTFDLDHTVAKLLTAYQRENLSVSGARVSE